MDLSIVIVNYKSAGLLKNCIQSIIESDTGDLRYEIIVVDNASNDGVAEMLKKNFADISLIQLPRNIGYGGANNAGFNRARGAYILVLNPDTRILDGAIKKLYDFMALQPRIGLLGPKLINPDGSLQYTRCRFPSFWIPLFRRLPLQHWRPIREKIDRFLTKDVSYEQMGAAEWLFGAVFLVRRDIVTAIGGFDERFFLAFEDTDLCRRVWQAGYEVWYYPQSVIIHYPHRFSSGKNWFTSLFKHNTWIHIASWLKYFWKYRNNPN